MNISLYFIVVLKGCVVMESIKVFDKWFEVVILDDNSQPKHLYHTKRCKLNPKYFNIFLEI